MIFFKVIILIVGTIFSVTSLLAIVNGDFERGLIYSLSAIISVGFLLFLERNR